MLRPAISRAHHLRRRSRPPAAPRLRAARHHHRRARRRRRAASRQSPRTASASETSSADSRRNCGIDGVLPPFDRSGRRSSAAPRSCAAPSRLQRIRPLAIRRLLQQRLQELVGRRSIWPRLRTWVIEQRQAHRVPSRASGKATASASGRRDRWPAACLPALQTRQTGQRQHANPAPFNFSTAGRSRRRRASSAASDRPRSTSTARKSPSIAGNRFTSRGFGDEARAAVSACQPQASRRHGETQTRAS